jgi:hypothetical protein
VIRPLTIALMLVAGMAIALVVTSGDRTERRELGLLASITDDDGFIRRAAWASLDEASGEARRAEIAARLAEPTTSRAVLADAARGYLDLGWPIDASHAVAAGEFGDADAFLAWFTPALGADDRALESAATAIRSIVSTDQRSADELMATLVAFAGSPADDARVERIARIIDDPTVTPIPRIRLALGRLGAPPRRSPVDFDDVDAVRWLLADPDTEVGAVLAKAPVWSLAAAGSPARRHLSTLEAEGRPDAARAIGLADPERVVRAERAVLADPSFGFDRRTIAAFRLLDSEAGPGDATILNLLDDGPADGDGTVHAAALLAWRGLSVTAASRLNARWISSDEVARRRAGIVLAAVRHLAGHVEVDPAIVAAIDRLAVDPAGDARTRRTARLATRVLGRWPHGDVDAAAYAARTTRLDDGRLDADAVLLGVLAGDADASRRLTTSPRMAPLPDPERAAAFARDIAWRRAIVSSLAAERCRSIGEPIPGDEDDLRLWIEALAADRLVSGPFLINPASIADSAPLDETLRP